MKPPPANPGEPPREDLAARVLYRDPMVLVIDKPAGLPVHAGPSGGPNLEAGLEALRFGAKDLPALAHRLDRDTSGCLALGRGPKGLKRLHRLFREGLVGKTYWALSASAPEGDAGVMDAPLLKRNDRSGWRMVIDPEGKPARSHWRVVARSDALCWLEFKPETGRTHQIRVHAAQIGCPILGDVHYGGAEGTFSLHARALDLPLYQDRPAVRVAAAPPPAFAAALDALAPDWRAVTTV